jgi:CRP-like cAMP-binding protein
VPGRSASSRCASSQATLNELEEGVAGDSCCRSSARSARRPSLRRLRDQGSTRGRRIRPASPISANSPKPHSEKPRAAAPKTSPISAHSASTLGKGERAVLTAIAQHRDGVSREQLTVLTGYTRSSRNTYIQRLKAAGLVDGDETLTATPAGIAELGPDFAPLPTGYALQKYWLERLSGGERTLLQVLCEHHPKPVTRDDLSKLTDYTRSSRNTYLQRLGARKLVFQVRGGFVPSEQLFDGGRS